MVNNQRRKKINTIIEKISYIKDEIEIIYEEEQDCMSNIPENLQGSDRYIQSEDACDIMSECIENLDDIISILEEVIEM